MTGAPALEALQEWMSVVVRHRVDAATAVRSKAARDHFPTGAVLRGDVVKPNDRMKPTARLDVYNGGYFTRLLEVLQHDYPTVMHVLGAHEFCQLALAYVERHPSRHPNLVRFGKELPEYITSRRKLPHRAFLRDLAELEKLVTSSFDAPEFTPLDTEPLATMTEEQWAAAVLELNPSVFVAEFRYPVNGYYQAMREGEDPQVPAPDKSWLAIYRKDERVWRMTLTRPMFEVLRALAEGTPFGAALGHADGAPDVTRWFQEWTGAGLFTALR